MWFVYHGGSMRGTFRDGDRLRVEAAPFAEIAIGDVVAVEHRGRAVAHRVVARSPLGLTTRGDANAGSDPDAATADHLIGRVAERERPGGCSEVAGGVRGRLRATTLRLGHAALRVVRRSLAAMYGRASAGGWLRRVWRPKVVAATFAVGDDRVVKLIHRGRTVATWRAASGRWACARPYDLVLTGPSSLRAPAAPAGT